MYHGLSSALSCEKRSDIEISYVTVRALSTAAVAARGLSVASNFRNLYEQFLMAACAFMIFATPTHLYCFSKAYILKLSPSGWATQG